MERGIVSIYLSAELFHRILGSDFCSQGNITDIQAPIHTCVATVKSAVKIPSYVATATALLGLSKHTQLKGTEQQVSFCVRMLRP